MGTTNLIVNGYNYAVGKVIRSFTFYTGISEAPQLFGMNFYNDYGNPRFTLSFPIHQETTGRAQRACEQIVNIGGVLYDATTNFIYFADDCRNDSDNRTIQSIHLQQLNGFTGSVIAHTIDYDSDTNETITTTTLDRANNKFTTTTSEPNTSSLTATQVCQNNLLVSVSSLSIASPTLYTYDALGRTNLVEDPQDDLILTQYDPNTGWLTSVTDPAGHATSYTYYSTNEANSGKLKCQTDANGKQTYYSYNTNNGKLYRTWGDVPHPAEYRYNEYGDLTNLITFRGGSGWNSSTWPGSPGTGDNTYWIYDPASGSLISKTDAQGKSVAYAYDTATARLLSRSWARTTVVTNADDGSTSIQNVTVTNYYDGFGDLTVQLYNDGTPNVLLTNYSRIGQPCEIVDGSGTNLLIYDSGSRLVSSMYISGPLAGIIVSNHFNPYYGRDALKVINISGTGWTLEDDYGYDAYGRLGTASSGTCSATYGYVPNSDLLQSTTFNNGSTTVMTTARSWNYGFQLASIANSVNGTTVTSHAYTYDSVNRRTETKLEDGSAWQYGYNDRNELTGANRFWYDSRPASGQQFGYNYDTIGNRVSAQFGGDINGNNLQTISYAANSLNQYSSIVTPGLKDILGAALATNSVTVNSGLADRHGEYFHRQINALNTNQSVWQSVTNISGTFTNKGGLAFPANNQTLVYDADGNLNFDGVWNYNWDGENRLISMNMTNVSGIANTNRLRLDFVYDGIGRRIEKIVSVWNPSTTEFQVSSTNNFVYDGWNLVASLNPDCSLVNSFVWGTDLGDVRMDAIGVGGLLIANFGNTNCFVGYDGNGNTTLLINAANGLQSAHYEYSPFGELIRETGLLATANPFRFSTKYWDEESGLVYYGSRYYSSEFGRWISRDPSAEAGGLHLYEFVYNSPICDFDPNGKIGYPSTFKRLVALADTIIQIGATVLTGHTTTSITQKIDEFTDALEKSNIKVAKDNGGSGGSDGDGESYKFPMSEGEYHEYHMKMMATSFLALSAIGEIAYIQSGQADKDSASFVQDAVDYTRAMIGGDENWADLNAAMIAIDMTNLTGNNNFGLAMYGGLEYTQTQ